MSKAIFKYNNGNGALLCNRCSAIIKTGKDYTPYEIKASKGEVKLVAQYCKKCKIKQKEVDKLILKFPII